MTATLEPTTTASGLKAGTGASPADVVRKAKEAGVQVVDLRFTDLPGTWQHFSIPLKELSEELFAEGIGFDGSSIRGFQAINESDMLLFPDPASAFVDPCLEVPTLSLTCDVSDPVTGQRYSRDPRYVAQKAEQYLVVVRSPPRSRHALLHRDVGAVQLLRDARVPHPVRHGVARVGRAGIRRPAWRERVQVVHELRLAHSYLGWP